VITLDLATVVPLTVTVILALVGYGLTYRNNVRLEQRRAHLERVDRQLSEFYGPLFATTAAAAIAWRGFRSLVPSRAGISFWGDPPPSEAEAATWRLWMKEVFMPLNLKMEALIVEKADLLVEPEMPDSLLQLCAHVEAYRTVLRKWEMQDFSDHVSVVEYPYELNAYARLRYRDLKAEQQRLLGQVRAAER
jgi:hypothetical protein